MNLDPDLVSIRFYMLSRSGSVTVNWIYFFHHLEMGKQLALVQLTGWLLLLIDIRAFAP